MKKNFIATMWGIIVFAIFFTGFTAFAAPKDTYVSGENNRKHTYRDNAEKNIYRDNAGKNLPDGVYTVSPQEVMEEEVMPIPSGVVAIQEGVVQLPKYNPWENVTLQGKLKMNGLPLSPTLKIFMKKDSLVDISIRAPFVGEAVRIQLSPDTLLLVNNMKKDYVAEDISSYGKKLGGVSISDIQNILLGRLFLSGYDWDAINVLDYIDLYPENESTINLVPKTQAKLPYVNYGFTVDQYFTPLMLMVIPEGSSDIEVDAFYAYRTQGYDIQFKYQDLNRGIYDATLELKHPEWNGEKPKAIDLGKKYRQVNLADFIRNF